MADLSYQVTVDTQRAQASLKGLQTQLGGVASAFGKFNTLLGGLAIGAAIRGAVQYADAIQDLSQATGIATQNVIGFSNAVVGAGGSAEKAQAGILRLVQTVGEAAGGSLAAQDAFARVGVSLADLANLSEQELLAKTIDGLSRVNDVSQRAVLTNELLGKSFRGIDIKALADGYGSATAAAAKYAESVREGARLQDNLDRAVNTLQLSLLKAIEPLAKFINGLDPEKVDRFISALVQIGGVIAPLALLANGLAKIGPALVGIGTTAAGLWLTFGKGLTQITKTIEIFKGQMKYAKDAISGASGVFAKFGQVGITIFTVLTKRLPQFIGGLLKMAGPIGIAVGAFMTLNEVIKAVFDVDILGNFFDGVIAGAKKVGVALGIIREEAAKPVEAAKGTQADARKADNAIEARAAREVTDALAAKRRELSAGTEAFGKQIQSQREGLDLDRKLIGMSAENADLERARADLNKQTAAEVEKLTEAKNKLSDAEKRAGMAAEYDKQIESVKQLGAAEEARLASSVKLLHAAQQAQRLAEFSTQTQVAGAAEVARLNDQAANMQLPAIGRAYAEIEQAAKASAAAEIAAEEARRGAKLSADEIAKYYAAARSNIDATKEATLRLAEAQKKLEFANFVKKEEIRLQDQLNRLQDESAKMGLSAIEQKYYDISAAARDSALEAIRAEEARRGEKLNPSEQKAYYDAASAGAKKLQASQKALYEQSRTFSAGWKKAFNEYRDSATNAAEAAGRIFEKFTSGLEDAIVGFAKTGKFEWKGFVDSMLEELLRSQIRETIGGLGDMLGLGDLFGGAGKGSGATRGQSASTPLYVMDVSGGAGGGNVIGSLAGAGGSTGLGGLISGGGIGGGSGGGILGTIGNIGGGIMDAISSAGSWLNENVFGGFFANGGTLGAGKVGIVGERGPELISGPASITPMSGGSVTYNINAVDAASFQALLARDPGFIHQLAQQGAKSMPYGRR